MNKTKSEVYDYLTAVKDPEVPVLDVVEMGIVRDVELGSDCCTVSITPTYSGCPAMETIENEIIRELRERRVPNVRVRTVFSPPWTTDWMTDEAKLKLKNYGIAPPAKSCGLSFLRSQDSDRPTCPRCDGHDTSLRSQFGSTACKALHYCNHCQEPFEHFKCI